MIRKAFLFSTMMLFALQVSAQEKISTLEAQSASLMQEKKYEQALPVMENLLVRTKNPKYDFQLAQLHSLLGNKEKALMYLNAYLQKGKIDTTIQSYIEFIPDFEPLHDMPEWKVFVQQIKEHNLNETSPYKDVIAVLDEVFDKDQNIRKDYNLLIAKGKGGTREEEVLIEKMQAIDSSNLIEIEKILDKYGWLGREEIGHKGVTTLFIVIQHADLEVQKKYQPILEKAVKDNKLEASNYAILVDRIAMREGKRQIYGSQIVVIDNKGAVLWPVEDIDNVDQRRATVKLTPTLEEYVSKNTGKKWSIEKYKEDVAALEKELNIK